MTWASAREIRPCFSRSPNKDSDWPTRDLPSITVVPILRNEPEEDQSSDASGEDRDADVLKQGFVHRLLAYGHTVGTGFGRGYRHLTGF